MQKPLQEMTYVELVQYLQATYGHAHWSQVEFIQWEYVQNKNKQTKEHL